MPASIEQVLRAHTDQWMAIPGVVATGIGEHAGKPCIRVMVVRKTRDITARIPAQADGYPVVIEETGEFRALPAE